MANPNSTCSGCGRDFDSVGYPIPGQETPTSAPNRHIPMASHGPEATQRSEDPIRPRSTPSNSFIPEYRPERFWVYDSNVYNGGYWQSRLVLNLPGPQQFVQNLPPTYHVQPLETRMSAQPPGQFSLPQLPSSGSFHTKREPNHLHANDQRNSNQPTTAPLSHKNSTPPGSSNISTRRPVQGQPFLRSSSHPPRNQAPAQRQLGEQTNRV